MVPCAWIEGGSWNEAQCAPAGHCTWLAAPVVGCWQGLRGDLLLVLEPGRHPRIHSRKLFSFVCLLAGHAECAGGGFPFQARGVDGGKGLHPQVRVCLTGVHISLLSRCRAVTGW